MLPGSIARRVVTEGVGTALLLTAVVGSGILAERLSGGNAGFANLANTLSTVAALIALILAFEPISGAHFNPAVTVADAFRGGLPWRETLPYILAQLLGAFAGVAVAHVMFGLPLFSASTHARPGMAQVFSEFVATFGLLAVIRGCSRLRPGAIPFAVGAYIFSASWFASSGSFANPAVTLARAATNTFTGMRITDAPGFLIAQMSGALSATLLFRWLLPDRSRRASGVVLPQVDRRAGGR